MIKFKKVELSDAELLFPAFDKYRGRICDYSAGNVLFWRDYYDISYYLGDEGFVLRYGDMDGVSCYSYPISDEPTRLIDALLFDMGELVLTCLTEEEYGLIREKYNVKETMYTEDFDDYLYNAEDIIYLRGRRYNGQRNHINKFKKSYPGATFEVIDEKNVSDAIEFCREYFDHIGKPTEVSDVECAALVEQLENFELYRQYGGILRDGEKIVGISIGEIVGDTLIIHTEKADTSYSGAYPMLTNSFAREFATDERVKYINREEDCGEEGLRISKRSYHPTEMIKKFAVRITK